MATSIPFRRDLEFTYGQVAEISPGIRRLIAENPGPFTLYGTGTYIVGRGEVAVIDPGPADSAHIDCLAGALKGERISHILVTHTHMDHSPGCRLLRQHTDARTFAYGPHGYGKLEQGTPVEEGGDMEFQPDILVRDGDLLEGDGWRIECVYTPGHTSNHMCYQLRSERALFTGDHVMGWSTSIISPPDGDMSDYLASLDKLLHRDDQVYWPTHGPCIQDPKPFVRAFQAHRRERHEQILACLAEGVQRITDMVPLMYRELPEFMYPAAARSVLASMEYLVQRQQVQVAGEVQLAAAYRLADSVS